MIHSISVNSFCDELAGILEKRANLLPQPDNGLAQIKPTSPKLTSALKGKTAPVSKVHSLPSMSPSQGFQPTSNAPQVRT